MPTLTISEFSDNGVNANGGQRQAAQLPALAHQTVTIDAAGRGTRDPLDALATVAGGALVLGRLLAADKWAGL